MLINRPSFQSLKMIKRYIVILLVIAGCASPTEFSEQALNDSFIALDGESVQLKEILETHKGKKILINVWASWCRDCVVGFPKYKEFQQEFPEVKYVMLSTNRNINSWKKAIAHYQLKGEHYFIKQGMDGDFGDFLNSNWIPRYLVVNENGFVDLFKAKSIKDPRIVEALKK